jgi:hypothetical protein
MPTMPAAATPDALVKPRCCCPEIFAGDEALATAILDRLLHKSVVLNRGQELSEHTAAKPAMLFFVKGEASVGLGDDVQEAQAGTWVDALLEALVNARHAERHRF